MKQLYNYQKLAIEQALKHDRFLLALDMGLGKTLCAINWLKRIQKKWISPNVIICDPIKVEDWKNECISEEVAGEVVVVDNDENKEKFKNLSQWPNTTFIITYRRLVLMWSQLKIKNYISVIIDESQALKSHTSKITKICLKLSPAIEKLLLLSGDPISTGYINLYPQMKLLNCFLPKYTYSDFVNEFCKTFLMKKGNRFFQVITGYKNSDYLVELLKSKAYFLKTEQAIELPNKQAFKYVAKLCPEYKKLKNNRVLFSNSWNYTADSTMKLMHGLRMLTSGVIKTDSGEFKELNSTKIEQLEYLINSSTYNFSIFYNYKAEAWAIKKLCQKLNVKCYQINGDSNDLEAIINESERFVVIIHYASGARGIDGLQHKIYNQIYYSLTYSGELHRQSLKRIHRIGQSKPVRYYFLLTEKSVDVNIYKALRTSDSYTVEMFEKDYLQGGQNNEMYISSL